MNQKEPLNTIPLENFTKKVKIADQSRSKQVVLSIDEAKELAFSIGTVTARLCSDLEKILVQQKQETQEIKVDLDGGPNWG